MAVLYQLYYFIIQGAPAVREAIRWARSHLQLIERVGMALAVVILGWSAGQAHIRRMRNWFLRRRNATLRPPTTIYLVANKYYTMFLYSGPDRLSKNIISYILQPCL